MLTLSEVDVALTAFLAKHKHRGARAPARALFDLFEQDRIVPEQFTIELEERGYKRMRTKHGMVWLGLALEPPGVKLEAAIVAHIATSCRHEGRECRYRKVDEDPRITADRAAKFAFLPDGPPAAALPTLERV